MWAEETSALCLRWMDPDSSAAPVWKPASGLNGFPLLISSSISISVLALLLSSYPTLHLSLCCSHFSSTAVTGQQSPFQPFSPFFSSSPIFLSSSTPPPPLLNILPWAQRYCRKGKHRVRQPAWFITCYLDSKTYDCAASTQAQCKPLHISKPPAFPICPYARRRPSWGISSAVNAGLFQTPSNVLFSSGGLCWTGERRYETGTMDGCGDVTVTAEGHFIKSYDRKTVVPQRCVCLKLEVYIWS